MAFETSRPSPEMPSSIELRVASDANGCWIWLGGRTSEGYAVRTWRPLGESPLVHRQAYTEMVGPIPKGMQLDHLCRVRHCVNPAHLEPVTPRENVMRGEGLTAINAKKTHCLRGHRLAGDNLIQGLNRRDCRICRRARQQRFIQRQAAR